MKATVWGQEGNSSSVTITSKEELLDFFETFIAREPFYCEFVEDKYKLSVCIRRDFGSVQHALATNAPPYMLAVTQATYDPDDEVDFFIGNESTTLSARNALPLDAAKRIIVYFLKTGQPDPSFGWDSV